MAKRATTMPHKKDPAAGAAPKEAATKMKSGESDKVAGTPPSVPKPPRLKVNIPINTIDSSQVVDLCGRAHLITPMWNFTVLYSAHGQGWPLGVVAARQRAAINETKLRNSFAGTTPPAAILSCLGGRGAGDIQQPGASD